MSAFWQVTLCDAACSVLVLVLVSVYIADCCIHLLYFTIPPVQKSVSPMPKAFLPEQVKEDNCGVLPANLKFTWITLLPSLSPLHWLFNCCFSSFMFVHDVMIM